MIAMVAGQAGMKLLYKVLEYFLLATYLVNQSLPDVIKITSAADGSDLVYETTSLPSEASPIMHHPTSCHSCVVLGIQPTIRSSVDGYKTVCPGEEVYFTCTVQNSVWLTWQSDQYIGQNTVIEFHRQFDHLGDGKSVSLPNASTSLFQLASLTNEKLESKSVIVVNKSAMDTGISCANDVQQIEERRLVLAEVPTAPTLLSEMTFHTNVNYLHFSLKPSSNIDRVDVDFYEVSVVNYNTTRRLSNNTVDYILPLQIHNDVMSHDIEIVAVDRCKQRSNASRITVTLDRSSQPSTSPCTVYGTLNSATCSNCQVYIQIGITLIMSLIFH